MSGGSFKDLKVYQKAYALAMEIFRISHKFPKEETYALTDQIRRSSRSVCANIAEAYRKRRYMKHFTSKITDADGEASETLVWVDFARDAGYISADMHKFLLRDTRKWEKCLVAWLIILSGSCRKNTRFLTIYWLTVLRMSKSNTATPRPSPVATSSGQTATATATCNSLAWKA